jgi:hypothetical protein
MPPLSRPTGRLLSDAEINYVNFGLSIAVPPAEQKRTLQRLCEWLEDGRLIQDASSTRQLIHSLVGSQHVLVRRWAIKALALIGHPEDFRRIADRLRVEEDAEAQTWGVTGLVKNAGGRSLKELCELAGLSNSAAISLAARLYAPKAWIAQHADEARISLGDDELTLKWAIFLIAYGKAPIDLFHPRFSNEVFLGELNAHDADDISEYSIWGLWERPDFGATHAKIPLDEAHKHPESVRKWLYRLATQSPVDVGLDPDVLSELRRDESTRAREGLAQGVYDLPPSDFGGQVLEWYTVEPDARVRENLLASMAGRSAESDDFSDAVRMQFEKEAPDSAMRHRLMAASVRTPLYPTLRRLDIEAKIARQGILEYGNQNITIMGDYKVNENNLSVGGNFSAQNVAVGDMFNSANGAVQQLHRSDEGTAQALQQVLALLERQKAVSGSEEVAAAVKLVAEAPTPENKKSLFDRLTSWVSGAAAIGTVIDGADKVIDVVGGLIA